MDDQGITLFRIGISFAAGILSFLSPCVLPLVPGYISLISGVSIDRLKEGTSSRRAVIVNSLAFNAGLSVIFLVLGTTAGLVGAAITSNPWVRIIGGLVIIAFGSAGLAVPFLLTGLGINQFLSFYKNFRKHLHKVEVISGIVLILVGVLVMSGQSTLLATSKFMAWVPNWEGRLKLGEKTPQP